MAFFRSHLIIISTYFLLLIPYAASLTFNLTNISPHNHNQDLVTEGNGANITDDGIQLTPYRNMTAGRAIYIKPLHLWDNTSGELASFSTNFSFVSDSNSAIPYADGLTFFLAEKNSVISLGRTMGLPVNFTTYVTTNKFVAVEFDTCWGEGDPRDSSGAPIGEHVAVRQDGLEYTIDLRMRLPEWVIFGFSAATGSQAQKNNLKSWTFNSSDLQVVSPDPVKGKKRTGLVVGLIVGLSVLISFPAVLAFSVWKRKKRYGRDEAEELGFDVEMNNEFEMGTGPKRFSYHELARSTADFAEKEKLGEGGFGGVYRGLLKDSNTYVAVKRVSKSSKQGIKEYASEVRIISRLRHRNLVQLIGWCHEKGELLLVYEFMENGSLDSHLFKAKSLLTWGMRYKIAHGLASALLYLHEEWEQCVLHRDIKSSNVMLDSNFNAKLGDFGLAKMVDHEKGSQTTMLAGTMGYMAPECVVTGKASKESDVFSFGVVALEIACGRRPVEYEAQEKQIRLVEWVWGLYGTEMLLEAADPHLGSDFEEEEIKRLMIVGLWSAHPDSNLRPSMRQAIQVLNSEAPLPILPSKMPVATYFSPPMSSLYGVTSIIKNQSSSTSNNTISSNLTASSTASSSSPSVSLLHSMN